LVYYINLLTYYTVYTSKNIEYMVTVGNNVWLKTYYFCYHLLVNYASWSLQKKKYDQNNQYYVLSFYLVGGSAKIVHHLYNFYQD